ncbi:MAG: hypothetical protein LLG20_18715 [Acidobacteriales bacterium]|nr:hypothetical protein [Terriglobales bacterium]
MSRFPVTACILFAGPEHRIRIGAKVFTFEMHHYCGPSVLGKRGDPLATQPGPRHPFWTAVSLWEQQGERVDAEGMCIFDIPPAERFRHVAGRNYLADPNGEYELREPEIERLIEAMKEVRQ